MLLVADIRPDYPFIKSDRRNKIPSSPGTSPVKFFTRPLKRLTIAIALFPLMYPITFDTAYFGGMLMHMCTWSGIMCPSTIFASLYPASSWNISPRCLRNTLNIRFFGMKTIWHLQSHLVWVKLWYSFILNLLLLFEIEDFQWPPYRSNHCESPGKVGGLPHWVTTFSIYNRQVEEVLERLKLLYDAHHIVFADYLSCLEAVQESRP